MSNMDWIDADATPVEERQLRRATIKNVSIVPEGEGFPGSHIELVNEELPPAPPPHAHMDEH